jgi:hypothetical protein
MLRIGKINALAMYVSDMDLTRLIRLSQQSISKLLANKLGRTSSVGARSGMLVRNDDSQSISL